METWLVTGHKGFIGKRLYAALPSGAKEGFDIRDNERLTGHHYDVIAHLGAESGIQAFTQAPVAASNVSVNAALYWAMRAAEEGSRIIFTSSCAAGNPEANFYAAAKNSIEVFLRTFHKVYGLNSSVLRLSNVYGPGSMEKTSVVAKMFKTAITMGEIQVVGNGYQQRDFVYVDDVVDVIKEVNGYNIWSVRTGNLTSIMELAEMIKTITGAKIVSANGPIGVVRPDDKTPRYPFKPMDLWVGLQKTYEYFKENFA